MCLWEEIVVRVLTLHVLWVVAVVAATCSCSKGPVPNGAPPETPGESPSTSLVSTDEETTSEGAEKTVWMPMASADYPDPTTGLPTDLPPAQPVDKYVALAWNDLGMHCSQSDFSTFQILPPYNVFWTQVIARGEKPAIFTEGIEVRYETLKVTDPVPHTNFWDYAAAYGWELEPGTGLKGKRTSGSMEAIENHFVAEGVPVVDFNDDGTWDPFPMFIVSVQDSTGETVAQTLNVAPASTEMACDLCHVADSVQGSMEAILKAHDKNEKTDLLSQAKAGKPVMCSSCHADPAMGVTENKDCELSLSAAIHGFHADKLTEAKRELPKNQCHACHPGPKTKCLRDIMSQAGITCTNCHGGMKEVGDPARTPWVNMPSCTTCHTDALEDPVASRIKNPNEHLTGDAALLYRNSKAHGGGGIYCAACHGSPHAVTPTSTERDNEQAVRLQGHKGPIDQCTLCHLEKPDGEFWHFKAGE